MSDPFNATHGPIYIRGEISGPTGRANVLLMLDTGATTRWIVPPRILLAGYDPDQASGKAHITTGSGTLLAPCYVLTRLTALGQHRFGFPVMTHPLPLAGVDGLLGLDFLRGLEITLNFRAGSITVA